MNKYNYELINKNKKNRDKFIVTLKADSNDGDYIHTIEEYSKKDFETYVLPELLYLKDNCSGDYALEKDDCDFNYLYIPYSDCGICHTLEYIKVEYIDSEGLIYDVNISNNDKMTRDKYDKLVESNL